MRHVDRLLRAPRAAARPQPSTQMLAAMARGLRPTLAERDHLYRLAGHDGARPRGPARPRQPGPRAGARPPRGHPGPGHERRRRDAGADPARGGSVRRRDRCAPAWRGRWCTAGSPNRSAGGVPGGHHPLHGQAFARPARRLRPAAHPGPRAGDRRRVARAQPRVRCGLARPRGRHRPRPGEAPVASGAGRDDPAVPAPARPRPGAGAAGTDATPGRSYEKLALLAVLGRQRMSG